MNRFNLLDSKVKIQKLKVVNDVLKALSFKDNDNAFTDVAIELDDFEKLTKKAIKKCDLFNNVSTLALFEMTKGATKKLSTNKAILGFLNRVLSNYAVKIQSKRFGKDKKKLSYSVKQIDLLQ